MSFGSPPSGSVPIVFNDHQVYSKPAHLKKGHLLAALVCGGTISVPLRTMFEQMGAAVSYDPPIFTIDITKPGVDVKVTVGKPEVMISGEARQLGPAPEMFERCILVPVRFISEAMGGYVQWVPNRHVVVVRYITGIPPPSPAPSPISKF